jgi:hypothetical protein
MNKCEDLLVGFMLLALLLGGVIYFVNADAVFYCENYCAVQDLNFSGYTPGNCECMTSGLIPQSMGGFINLSVVYG